jgi:signal transduction histidine kinase
MGRLFWKFFLFIWLGQMAAVFGTGMLFWAERKSFERHLNGGGEAPPADSDANRLQRRPPPPPAEFGRPPPAGDFAGPPPHGPGGGRPPGMPVPIFPVFAGLLASVLCAAGLAWYFSRPIRQLRSGFDRVADGDLDARVAPGMQGRRDELADLGRDFDRMTERLQGVVEGQQRLLHDVSHEMRSPLARLQAAIGLARQQPTRLDDCLQRVERESERMNQLVGQLLTLSRLEAGVTEATEWVDMAELLAGIIEDARFEAAARQVVIDYRAGEMAEIRANSELLHRAIENVLRNAIRYSPEGGRVGVTAGRTGEIFHVRIADQGPGVAADELEAIFKPFFRGGAARSGDGHGLGLAIARRVMLAIRGRIDASRGEGGGLVVEIEMPA